jgi:hypothetical protein
MPWNNDYIRKSRSRSITITYPWGVGSNLSGLIELSALEELLVLLDIQVIRARKVSPASKLEGQFGIVQCREDIRNDGVLVDIHAQNLALLVHADDTVRGLMFSRDEDGFAGNSVHVDTCARFEVVEVNEAVFCDQIDDSVLFCDLHCNWEIVRRLWGEVDVDLLFGEYGI